MRGKKSNSETFTRKEELCCWIRVNPCKYNLRG